MLEYIEKLKGSQLVWDFQYYFGVRRTTAAFSSRAQDTAAVTTDKCHSTVYSSKLVDRKHGHDLKNSENHSLRNGIIGSSSYSCDSRHEREDNHVNDNLVKPIANGHHSECNGGLIVNGREKVLSKSNINGTSNDEASTSGTSDSDSGSLVSSSSEYVITSPFWYYLFSFGAALGDEAFFSSFFPFWFWNIDGAVCRRVVMIWVLIMYIGQGLKDVIRWPRPTSPPVIRLEGKWALEYGMPSTHAMVGAAVPFSFLFYTMYRYEYPVILGVVVCSIWCCLVCGSRLYLGMHSVLDIIVGIILVVILMAILMPFIDTIDHFTLTSPIAPPCILATCLLMILCYPDAGHWTPARGDTILIIAVGAGVTMGSWLNYRLGIISGPPMPPPYKILWPTYEMMGIIGLRTCIGILVVVATRAIFKSLTYALVCYMLKLDPRDKRNWRKTAVDTTAKFITYTVIALNVTYSSPAVFRFMNIERVTMFTEV